MYLICGEALFDVFLDRENESGTLHFDARAGGSPFNVAIGIARLGGSAALLTGVSTDMLGTRLVRALERESVSTDYLLRSGRRTTLSLVALDDEGQPQYVFYGLGSADRHVSLDDLPVISPEVTGLHFGSYSLVVQPVADAFMTLARTAGERLVSIDPNVRPTVESDLDIWRERVADYSKLADVIKISAEDLQFLYPDAEASAKAADWLDSGVKLVIVTDGARDVRAWTSSGFRVSVTPPAAQVVDTVGAGDSFQSAVLASLARYGSPLTTLASLNEDQLEALLRFAQRAAAVTCSRRGADLPYSHEVVSSPG